MNWSCNISGGVLFISYPRSHVYDVETEHLFHPDKSSNPKNQTPRTTYCLRDGKHLYGILIWLPINKIMSPTHATYYLHFRRAWLLQLSLIYKIQIFYSLNPQHNAFPDKSRIERLAKFRSDLPVACYALWKILRSAFTRPVRWTFTLKSFWHIHLVASFVSNVLLCLDSRVQDFNKNRSIEGTDGRALATLPIRTIFRPLCYIRFNKHQQY